MNRHRPYLKDDDDRVTLIWEILIYECAKQMWPKLTPEQFGEASHALVESHALDDDFSISTMLRIIGEELTKRHGPALSLEEIAAKDTKRLLRLSSRMQSVQSRQEHD
jgi:hypothetical protein